MNRSIPPSSRRSVPNAATDPGSSSVSSADCSTATVSAGWPLISTTVRRPCSSSVAAARSNRTVSRTLRNQYSPSRSPVSTTSPVTPDMNGTLDDRG